MKKIILFSVFAMLGTPLFAQKNLLPKFIRKMLFEQDSGKHSSFFLLPVFGSAPETGVEVGGSALYSFYTDTLNSDTRVSNIFGYATITTQGQSRVSLSTSYWTPHNIWHYTAAISYINFPFDFYGIGPNTFKANKSRLGQKRTKLNFQAEKLIAKHLYVGLMVGGFDYKYTSETPGSLFDTSPLIEDRSGGASLLAGPALLFDTRNNNTYTTKGIFVNSYFNVYKGIFGNNGYKGGFLNVEISQYNTLGKRFMLGFNLQTQMLTGAGSPFYLLPTLGNDEIMRGYYNGRYRDRNLIAAQYELRYRISDRWAIAGFGGAGTVFNKTFAASDLKPSAGGGFRYFFDVQKGLTLRADYAIGEKVGSEARQSGFYLSLGESF